jgi:hypothetical protein
MSEKEFEELEERLRSMRLSASQALDERVRETLGKARAAATSSEGTNAAVSPLQAGIFSNIRAFLRRHVLALKAGSIAAAFLAAAGAVIGYLAFFSGSNVTWAAVQEAVAEQTWVHIEYDNGREDWTNLKTGQRYYRDESGRAVFLDPVKGLKLHYWPESGFVSQRSITPWEPAAKTAWESTVGHYEKPEGGLAKNVEKYEETLDGKRLVRFDLYYIDPLGERLLIKQVWADPQTRLPVRVRERLQLALRESQGRDWIIGRYDFPEEGPASIYDLGVPEGLEIVKSDAPVPPEVLEILDKGKAAKERFPSRFRVIVWQDKRSEIDVIYRDGEKVRQRRYFNMEPEYAGYHLPLPATAREVLDWTGTQIPVNDGLFDGELCYTKSGPLPPAFRDQEEPKVQVGKSNLLNSSNWPEEFQWPYVAGVKTGLELMTDSAETPPGCIGLRRNFGDDRRDLFLDPARDYICVKYVWWEKRDGEWIVTREEELSGFTALPGGQWQATRQKLVIPANPQRGTSKGEYTYKIDVRVLEEDEFPEGIFDAQELLEGAQVETF